jgi:lipopolysaccharide transport system ATP-binding protein
MQDVSRGGRTVLFISHNMSAISTLCSRAVVMEAGRPVFDGPAREAVRQYLEHNLADAALNWDLGTAPRLETDLGALVRIERVRATAARAEGFRFEEPLRFHVGVTSAVTMAQIECAIGLDDMYGSRVVTFTSEGARFAASPGGSYEVEVTVPPFGLRPGKYLLSASLASGGQYHDYLIHFGAVSVVPLHQDGNRPVDDQGDRGPIAVPSEWRILEGALV